MEEAAGCRWSKESADPGSDGENRVGEGHKGYRYKGSREGWGGEGRPAADICEIWREETGGR